LFSRSPILTTALSGVMETAKFLLRNHGRAEEESTKTNVAFS